jgi:hypothetical protein
VSDSLPPWLGGELVADDSIERTPLPREWIIAGIVLLSMLCIQLLHHNRDALAASPTFGGMIRGFYGGFGSDLYPEWKLESFEIRGTEAVAGSGEPPALNILAKVIVAGAEPIGMPLIRVVLRDRWSDPVASGVFPPIDYLRGEQTPPRTVQPGAMLPIAITVADPGAEARGYVVDVCLPRRKTGLQCQLAKDPFLP